MINVTKSYLPDKQEYLKYIQQIWESSHLTNHGPLVNELESKLKVYLGVKHLFLLNNGTIALQIAIKALDLKGEIITTPFSYVATTSSIVWENCVPIFADIDKTTLTIDADKIEPLISDKTSAILATHVYGIPCNVEKIKTLAEKYNLKVIYDAAHAFGVHYKNSGILNFGDVSTLSFHATKLFHTIEGGAIATNDDVLAHRISYMRNFGHKGQEDFWGIGINGKMNEFSAAMGLCIFPKLKEIIVARKNASNLYDSFLLNNNQGTNRPTIPAETTYNYSYYPILLENKQKLKQVKDALNALAIYPRRYFYPPLNKLPYIQEQSCPITEDISARVLCLPLYHDLGNEDIKLICETILHTLKFSL